MTYRKRHQQQPEDNVPPSPDVQQAQEVHDAERAYRRRVFRYYAPWVVIAALTLAVVWWNAAAGSQYPWIPAATSSFWVLWGCWSNTQGRAKGFEDGWVLGSTHTLICVHTGRDPGPYVPHISVAGELEKQQDKVADVIRKWQADNPKADQEDEA